MRKTETIYNFTEVFLVNMNTTRKIQLIAGLLFFIAGVNSLISGEASGIGLVSQKTRPITQMENPIEFFLVVSFRLTCGVWFLKCGVFGKKN